MQGLNYKVTLVGCLSLQVAQYRFHKDKQVLVSDHKVIDYVKSHPDFTCVLADAYGHEPKVLSKAEKAAQVKASADKKKAEEAEAKKLKKQEEAEAKRAVKLPAADQSAPPASVDEGEVDDSEDVDADSEDAEGEEE